MLLRHALCVRQWRRITMPPPASQGWARRSAFDLGPRSHRNERHASVWLVSRSNLTAEALPWSPQSHCRSRSSLDRQRLATWCPSFQTTSRPKQCPAQQHIVRLRDGYSCYRASVRFSQCSAVSKSTLILRPSRCPPSPITVPNNGHMASHQSVRSLRSSLVV